MSEERYYELLKEAYVNAIDNWSRVKVFYLHNRLYHELAAAYLNHIILLERLERDYGPI